MSVLEKATPEGYKQTEVGLIPDDWNIVAIEDLVEPTSPICYGVVQVGKYSESGVPIVAIKYVENISSAPLHRSPVELEKSFVRSRLKGGDVLISIKGTIGRVGVVPDKFQGNISRELARVRVKSEYLSQFVAYQLKAFNTQDRIMKSVVGSTRLEFSILTLRKFKIVVPSSKLEQKEIVNTLTDIDALLTELEKLIAKKQAIKTATMQQLLTGKNRLPQFATYTEGEKLGQLKGTKLSELGEIPEDWEVDRIGSVVSITTGSKNTQDKLTDGKYPFFVRSQKVERINTYSFDGEAVLTAGDGVGTGKIFHYINGKFDYHQRVYLMHNFVERIDGYYFYIYFSNYFYDRIMSMTAKSSVDSVRREMIAEMPIYLPSVEEQKAIAAILSDMDNEIQALEQRLAKTHQIKQGMMQELLTGRTRLPISTEAV